MTTCISASCRYEYIIAYNINYTIILPPPDVAVGADPKENPVIHITHVQTDKHHNNVRCKWWFDLTWLFQLTHTYIYLQVRIDLQYAIPYNINYTIILPPPDVAAGADPKVDADPKESAVIHITHI